MTNSIEKLRFEFSNIGIAAYITIIQLIMNENDHKLPLSTCNVGIIAEKLRITEEKLMDILTSIIEETEIFDKKSFEEGYLFCPELERNIIECSK